MTLWHGAVLAFCIFVGLLALFIGWGLNAGQKALDRHFELEDRAMREAMKRWPP